MPSLRSLLNRVKKLKTSEEKPCMYIERGYRDENELESFRDEVRDMDARGIVICRFYEIKD